MLKGSLSAIGRLSKRRLSRSMVLRLHSVLRGVGSRNNTGRKHYPVYRILAVFEKAGTPVCRPSRAIEIGFGHRRRTIVLYGSGTRAPGRASRPSSEMSSCSQFSSRTSSSLAGSNEYFGDCIRHFRSQNWSQPVKAKQWRFGGFRSVRVRQKFDHTVIYVARAYCTLE
jgi:hypothetical protein